MHSLLGIPVRISPHLKPEVVAHRIPEVRFPHSAKHRAWKWLVAQRRKLARPVHGQAAYLIDTGALSRSLGLMSMPFFEGDRQVIVTDKGTYERALDELPRMPSAYRSVPTVTTNTTAKPDVDEPFTIDPIKRAIDLLATMGIKLP